MAACEKCWADAYTRSINDPEKSQAEHYEDLLKERKDHPCLPASKIFMIDLQIYVRAMAIEVPVNLPQRLIADGYLVTGYHTIDMVFTEQEMDHFRDWAFVHGDIMKIIGEEARPIPEKVE